MAVEENSLKRSNYKLFLFINKYLPYIISVLYMVNTVFTLFGIDLIFLSILGGLSILPVLYFISVSFTFGYCVYHRLPLYYIIVNDLLSWCDYLIGIPISTTWIVIVSVLLMFITIVTTTILYLKEKKKEKNEINGSNKE